MHPGFRDFVMGYILRLNPEKEKKTLKEINHCKEIINPPYGQVDRKQIVCFFAFSGLVLLNILVVIFSSSKNFSVIFYQKYFCFFFEKSFGVFHFPEFHRDWEKMAEAGGVRQHFNICRRAHNISTHKIPKMSNHKKSILNSSHKIPKNIIS